MTDDRPPPPEPESPAAPGETTGTSGTPLPVDLSADRRTRVGWVVLLGGPVVWFAHFMIVYLIVEAGCTGGGPGLSLLDPPVPAIATLAFTAAAILACLWLGRWGRREWRAGPAPQGELDAVDSSIGFAGMILSMLSVIAIAFVGLPALVLPAC